MFHVRGPERNEEKMGGISLRSSRSLLALVSGKALVAGSDRALIRTDLLWLFLLLVSAMTVMVFTDG